MTQVGRHRVILAAIAFLALGATRAVPVYGGATFDVKVGETAVGVFTIDTYEASSVPGVSFGVAIRGGFTPASDYSLPDGYEYRWVQTVSSSIPAYDWQTPGLEYVDRTRVEDSTGELTLARSQSPFYNDGLVVPNDYAIPFADNPSRLDGASDFTGTWRLSLVAVEASSDVSAFNQAIPGAERDIYLITTFVWGFELQEVDGVLTVVLLDPIQELEADPDRLAAAFAADPDQTTFGDGAWVIRGGLPTATPGAIPEPSSYLLALTALLGVSAPVLRSRLCSA